MEDSNKKMPTSRRGIILMIAGVLIMFLGYILMIGGGSSDPEVFNPAMFDFRRITLSPIVILAGIVVVIVGIMYAGKGRK